MSKVVESLLFFFHLYLCLTSLFYCHILPRNPPSFSPNSRAPPNLSLSSISPFLPSHFYLLFSLFFLSLSLYLCLSTPILFSCDFCFPEFSISDLSLSLSPCAPILVVLCHNLRFEISIPSLQLLQFCFLFFCFLGF